MPNKLFSLIALFCLIFCGQIISVYPQVTTATISGVVTDETGGLIPGVSIEVTNLDTGITRTTTTGDEGRYQVPNLSVGNYQVESSLPGFQTAVRTGITLTVGREALVDFALRVGEISERVTVTGEAPLVETTTAQLSALVEQQKIEDLPLNGRSYTQLALLQPGVVTLGRQSFSTIHGGGAKLSIAGARSTNTYFYLDGTETKDSYGHTPGSAAGTTLGVDTIREFSVEVSSFSAEYGGSGGVINSVTKSGTNEFHGSVFEYHRNSALDARNFFDTDSRTPLERSDPPPFERNQFGFTLGGPIIEDRTFFFGSYEGLRERLTNTSIVTTPTAETRQGILPDGPVVIHPEIRPYLDAYPLPNGRIFNDGTGEFTSSASRPINEDYFMVKVDHQLNDSHSLFVRYTFDDANRSQPTDFVEFFGEAETRNQYVTIEANSTLSTVWLNTFRVGLNRSRGGDLNISEGLDSSLVLIPFPERIPPHIRVPGVSRWGPSLQGDRFATINVFQYSDKVTYSKGRHSIRMGADLYRYQFNGVSKPRFHGRLGFATFRDYFEGRTNLFEFMFPGTGAMRGFRQTVPAFYIQDDFQLRPNLTLNMGLRFEYSTVTTEVAGRISNLRDLVNDTELTVGDPFFKLPKNNFGPRFGIAWDPFGTGTTSVRAGFGLYHMQMTYVNWRFPALGNPPFTIRVQVRNPPGDFPPVIDPNAPPPTPQPAPFQFEPKTPYMMQYNFTVQRELMPDTVLVASYVGSRGVHLGRLPNFNIADFTLLPDGRKFWPAGAERRNPAFASMDVRQYDTNSVYSSLQLQLKKRFSDGIQFQGSYTWAHAIDMAIGQEAFSGGWDAFSMDPFDPSLDRGRSSWDIRHNFVLNFTYDLPFGRNQTGAAGKILGGWQTSGILNLHTGPPFTATVRFNNSRNLNTPAIPIPVERPNLKAGADNNPVLGGPDRYVDSSPFEVADVGTLGDLGRNTIDKPGHATFDFSLNKNTYVSEQVNVQFRAEFFNIFNRANFGTPSGVVFSRPGAPATNSFGRIRSTNTTSRQIQFALKILF